MKPKLHSPQDPHPIYLLRRSRNPKITLHCSGRRRCRSSFGDMFILDRYCWICEDFGGGRAQPLGRSHSLSLSLPGLLSPVGWKAGRLTKSVTGSVDDVPLNARWHESLAREVCNSEWRLGTVVRVKISQVWILRW